MVAGDVVELVKESVDGLVDDVVTVTFLRDVVLDYCVLITVVVCVVWCDP